MHDIVGNLGGNGVLILRLVVALLLGMILGLERLRAHKVAGMRTYGLVSLSAALFVLIGQVVNGISSGGAGVSVNPLAMAAAIISGIGFLGAGLIIFQKNHVQNLTTAAALWIAAAVGVAAGFGMYIAALGGTALALFVLSLHGFEMKIKEKWFSDGSEEESRD